MGTMTIDEAIIKLRNDPKYSTVVRDAYLGEDVLDSAQRFAATEEFALIKTRMGKRLQGGVVLDLGAGTGISTWAMLKSGASKVYAIEPDASDLIGRGALQKLCAGMPVEIIDAYGESLPVPDGSVEIVYTRQVLHHTQDLNQVLKECYRVLKPGGIFVACREHVVDDEEQRRIFLQNHVMHQLTESEGAYSLDEYVGAIKGAGFTKYDVIDPWDSIINAFPRVRTEAERIDYARVVLQRKFGVLGTLASALPGVQPAIWRHIRRPVPGRFYSFIAEKA